MKKRLSAALAAACLTLALLPGSALALDIYSTSSSPDPIWAIPSSAGDFNSLPPFTPANKDSSAEVAWSKLNNLIWLSFVLREEFELPYTDVPRDSWFYPGVCYVYVRSLMDGVSEDTFAPYEPVTRGLAWTVLASMNGVDTRPANGETWYARGMNWVVDRQVSDGTNPLEPVTREQWASMLWRRSDCPVTEIDLSVYSDGASVSGYAQDAMRWAISIGIIQGSDGKLLPRNTLSRAELATMVMRLAPKAR